MQLNDYYTRLTSLALFNKVKNLVDQSLLDDWVIWIEYGEQQSNGEASWQQWHKPFYAVQDAEQLNEEILKCRMCFPVHPIRLYAEKLNPRTKMIYWVYSPQSSSIPEATPELDYTSISVEAVPQKMRA